MSIPCGVYAGTFWGPSPHNDTVQEKTPTHNFHSSVEKHLRLVEVKTRTYDGRSISFVHRPSILSQLLWGNSCEYQYSSSVHQSTWFRAGLSELSFRKILLFTFSPAASIPCGVIAVWLVCMGFSAQNVHVNLLIITSLTKSTGSSVYLSPWQSSTYACHLYVVSVDGIFIRKWTQGHLPL
jgi:hypothetical protein